MHFLQPLVIVLQWSLYLSSALAQTSNTTLPIVDLGYEIHQADFFNETGNFYNFSNIPYAASPLEDLRFRGPQPPPTNRSAVNTGSVGKICPQSYPAWLIEGQFFVANYTQGHVFNVSVWDAEAPNITINTFPVDPRETEDCLVLDVVVPQNILESANTSSSCGAPVIVWIHGGGFAVGSKDFYGSPSGILARSKVTTSEGVIFVSMNYRLGAFGFLSGSTLQADGNANAGLLDQRLALEWVQEHISKFGGDPNRVTVMGESAGGGSIIYHITAYGGKNGSAPFLRAIPQSPAYTPYQTADEEESMFESFLTAANVSSLTELRNLSSEALITANLQATLNAAYGTFPYTPVVDGTYVPDLPQLLLLNGEYDDSIQLLIGHNSEEGVLFTNPIITTETAFDNSITSAFPNVSTSIINYIENNLYPPPSIFNDSSQYPYTNNLDRAILLNSEVIILCNANALDKAFKNKTYAYIFDVAPAVHGADVPYTFYTGPFGANYSSSSFNTTVAEVMLDYFTTFAEGGVPSTGVVGVPVLGTYGVDAVAVDLSTEGVSLVRDPADNTRCEWWQRALFANSTAS